MQIFKVSIFNIFYIFCLIIPFLLFITDINVAYSLIIPYSIAMFIAFIIAVIININTKNRFYSRIYLLTTLFHLLAGIFIQILKYKILNLPTIGGFAGIGIDNDGTLYHNYAKILLQNPQYDTLFFAKIVAIIYKIFGVNEYTVCAINALFSGFISFFIVKMGETIYKDNFTVKFLGYITTFSFTVTAYTSVLMRDVYIILLSYMIIFFYYVFYKKKNIYYLLFSIFSFFLLCPIRAYAAAATFIACITAHLILVSNLKYKNFIIKTNRYMITVFIMVIVILTLLIIFQNFLRIDYIISLFDMDTILKVSEEGYGGANSSFGIDRVALSKCLPLFLLIGYFCMFFAPFPHQWLLSKNIVQAFSASETIILYIFLLPSFFMGIIKGFKDRNFIIVSSFLYIIFVFTFYGMILDNSGAVFRGRAPFIPLIYLIALYNTKGLLLKICNKTKKIIHKGSYYEKNIIS